MENRNITYVDTDNDDLTPRITPGRWRELSISDKENDHRFIIVPIIPGKEVKIFFRYDGEISTNDQDKAEFWKVTFPYTNALMHKDNLESYENGVYVFSNRFCPLEDFQIGGSIEDMINNTPKNIKNKYVNYNGASKTISALRDAIIEDGYNDDVDYFLREVAGFASYQVNGYRSEELGGEDDMDSLLEQSLMHNEINGTCKALSTFVCGLLNSAGLAARRVEGFLEIPDEEIRMGHAWAELYVPSKKLWVPVDYDGALKTVPDDRMYDYSSDIPKLLGSNNFEIKIEYC